MQWHDLGPVADFQKSPITEARAGRMLIAVSWQNGTFGAVSGVCNHAGGPLGQGRLDGDFIQCPWHGWKFHRLTGDGEPGFEEDKVPRHEVKVEHGHLYVSAEAVTPRKKKPHAPHALSRTPVRKEGPIRVAGISTTNMDPGNPRYSTSEALLEVALEHSRTALACETRIIQLRDLKFRACEGYYSKSAQACTWPCSITQMDEADEMTEVYEALVHWSDVAIVATPIRWGAASSLFFKMAERLNCVQNQITIKDRLLIRNKVAAFIVTGGQDNVQAVAGHLLLFFSELGFSFPQFPFIAHSRGWSAEDMERNVEHVMKSEELRTGAMELAGRAAVGRPTTSSCACDSRARQRIHCARSLGRNAESHRQRGTASASLWNFRAGDGAILAARQSQVAIASSIQPVLRARQIVARYMPVFSDEWNAVSAERERQSAPRREIIASCRWGSARCASCGSSPCAGGSLTRMIVTAGREIKQGGGISRSHPPPSFNLRGRPLRFRPRMRQLVMRDHEQSPGSVPDGPQTML